MFKASVSMYFCREFCKMSAAIIWRPPSSGWRRSSKGPKLNATLLQTFIERTSEWIINSTWWDVCSDLYLNSLPTKQFTTFLKFHPVQECNTGRSQCTLAQSAQPISRSKPSTAGWLEESDCWLVQSSGASRAKRNRLEQRERGQQ